MNDVSGNKKFYIARKIGRLFYRKHIWLVSDRKTSAGDNGEAFFKYLQNKKVNAVFAINEDSKDYERMKKYGKVVKIGSKLHSFYLCMADVYLSSHLEYYERRHSETPLVFLQHGVADKDISNYINSFARKNSYTIVSTEYENVSFVKEPYKWDKEHVWLTGLPRFDFLQNHDQKKIVLSLTWRTDLAEYNNATKEDFLNSDYYRNILAVLKSEKIKQLMLENGYQLSIKLHPMMEQYEDILECPEHVEIWKKSYADLFAEASMLITDYSSIFNDFIIQGKPIIYYQPKISDANVHVWKNVFDYEADGFGEVTYSVQELEQVLAEYVENQCTMKEKYLTRTKKHFKYIDRNNCDRVYEQVVSMIKKNR